MNDINVDNMSTIQQEILKRASERDSIPRRGFIEAENMNPDDSEDKFYFNFLGAGPRFEIHGKSDRSYEVLFVNKETGQVLKKFIDVKVGEWVQAEEEYYIPWLIQVAFIDESGERKAENFAISLEDKNVFISFESSALGDTIAWMPVIDEFRKKYQCKVFVSSFHNDLFKDIYKNMLFIDRGMPLHGMQFNYKLGWFGSGHASTRNPYDCQLRNLQQIAMDILGLKYEDVGELRPLLKKSIAPRKVKGKYVAITTCSTAQFKYWNYAGGWQQIVDYLVRKGYQVVNIGKQPNVLHNVVNGTGQLEFDDLLNVLQNAEFFIGLPSGLAWLNWALDKKTIMISGISEHFCEFKNDMYRVQNDSETGCAVKCFNRTESKYLFDKGSWLHCPDYQGVKDHFKCTKTITPEMVKKKISLVEKHIKLNINTVLDINGDLTNKKTGELICKLGE